MRFSFGVRVFHLSASILKSRQVFRLRALVLASASFVSTLHFWHQRLLPRRFSFNVTDFCLRTSVSTLLGSVSGSTVFALALQFWNQQLSSLGASFSASASFSSAHQFRPILFRHQRVLPRSFSFGVSGYCFSASVLASASFASALQ